MLKYFAHNGVEHATAAETSAHQNGSDLPVLLAVSAVILVAAIVVIKLLSGKSDTSAKDKPEKEKAK